MYINCEEEKWPVIVISIRWLFTGLAVFVLETIAFLIAYNNYQSAIRANVLAIFISSAFSYYANVKFVFKQNPNLASFGNFCISICISMFANTIVLHNIIILVNLEPIFAKVMTTTLLLPVNFVISKKIFVRGS